MRSLSKHLALTLALLGAFAFTAAAQAPPTGRIVLVLPFDNRSGDPSLSWIGDSFPDTLNKRLASAGFLTISRDDRAFAFDHLGLPRDFRPSRATTIRIAQQLDANYVVIGSFTSANDHISIQAQVLSLDALTLSSAIQDSAELPRLFDVENAIAWKVARALDPHFNVAEATFLAAAGGVPLAAFEDYIRGTYAPTPAERLKRLQAAVNLVPTYAAALLALGKEQYAARDYTAAATTLAKVPTNDRLALEANFYLGLARFNSASYAPAQQAFHFVATGLPLPEIINDEAVSLSRQGKDAVDLFRRAANDDPNDEDFHYNLAVALFRRGETSTAAAEVETALKLKPTDNEALQLRTLLAASPGQRLSANTGTGFIPVERIRRDYNEAGFRQAAFQLDQLRSARFATLPPTERAVQYTQLGNDYLTQGLLPEAEGQFQFALAADPDNAAAHAGLAQVREQSGDSAEARAEAFRSNNLKPNATAWLVLARLDLAQKQYATSMDEVTHALQLEPANLAAQSLRTTIQQRRDAAVPITP